jgi:hypothetical protein
VLLLQPVLLCRSERGGREEGLTWESQWRSRENKSKTSKARRFAGEQQTTLVLSPRRRRKSRGTGERLLAERLPGFWMRVWMRTRRESFTRNLLCRVEGLEVRERDSMIDDSLFITESGEGDDTTASSCR